MGELAQRLLEAVGPEREYAGIAVSSQYRPASGDKVFPPSFPLSESEKKRGVSPYLSEKRWVEGELCDVVVLDQPPSQANRMEMALLEARDAGQIALPLFELQAETSWGPLRLTSLEFPHRFADAYLRDSLLEGKPFDSSEVGKRLRSVSARDVRPLFERSPESLLFGAWDSHRKGRGVKLARLYSSSMVGLNPVEGKRKGGRMDPFNLTGAVRDSTVEDWEFVATGAKLKKKEGEKLSETGHGNIAPGDVHGGVAITEARRMGWLSLSGVGQLRFGDASPQAAQLARATLAALALAGDRLAFGAPSVWLRSGCDLIRGSEVMAFDRDGQQQEAFTVSAAEAVSCFHELRERTAEAGITMAGDTITVTPKKALAEAIEYATTRAGADEDAGEE
ncbi:type I-G CRISPR-associated RAMP protein Csb1/Cas7g [Salinactinospora qingdaonensis]|uniref:CRISPR-associated protein Csb1 n=1 Tax=Salinactinospora qingdaonensis TaxID=702744 RepID=A0ABP7F8A0_9ACTN